MEKTEVSYNRELKAQIDQLSYKFLLEKINSVEINLLKEIIHFRELYESEKKSKEEALKLQAQKYEDKLLALNHEREQVQELKNMTLPRETFDEFRNGSYTKTESAVSGLVIWQSAISERIGVVEKTSKDVSTVTGGLTTWKSGVNGRIIGFGTISIILSVIGFAIALYKLFNN